VNLQESINIRRSRRKYIAKPMGQAEIQQLQSLISEYNDKGNFRFELVLNNGDAFNGITRSYGMFSDVQNYIGLIAKTNDPISREGLGYFGQLLVLHATALGLGTCWVGGTFSKSKLPFELGTDEEVIATITVGLVEAENNFKERLVHKLTHRKTKKLEDMYQSAVPTPDWFLASMQAVAKAPSGMNKQPVIFTYEDGKVTATNTSKYSPELDLGIAKLHFELGAGSGQWKWGNGGEFVK